MRDVFRTRQMVQRWTPEQNLFAYVDSDLSLSCRM